MELIKLIVTGPGKEPAVLTFGDGFSVVQGAANTGKSHVVALIDFVLGKGEGPEPIAEQAGYDTAFLTVRIGGNVLYTFCSRAIAFASAASA